MRGPEPAPANPLLGPSQDGPRVSLGAIRFYRRRRARRGVQLEPSHGREEWVLGERLRRDTDTAAIYSWWKNSTAS
jgi:hypothetical protein